MAQENHTNLSKSKNLEHTIYKELLTISKCDDYLNDLDNDAKKRVLIYLLDKHGVSHRYINLSVASYLEGQQFLSKELDSGLYSEKIKQQNHLFQNEKKHQATREVITFENTYTLISDLNLTPKNIISLKDYYNLFDTKNNYENTIVILSYLKNELKEKKINHNHIYTCYIHLGLKIPAIRQCIFDTQRRRGWVKCCNRNDIKITISGKKYLNRIIKRHE